MEAVLKAVSSPRRRRILELVWEDERTAGDIAGEFDVTFGAVSQQLAVLRDAGVVSVRRDGRRRYYHARRDALGPLADMLEAEWARRLDRLKSLAEREVGHGEG